MKPTSWGRSLRAATWWERVGFNARIGIMAAARKVVELSIAEVELAQLQSIARSRTEPASRVERARILLRYRDDPSSYAVGMQLG